jgi:error-prone DNA polymerase
MFLFPRSLTDVPPEDPLVYDMICAADTVGVFQIESRAQMSMLPRLKPLCFYDLVIEVAIVRPGPIQGGMVHPYLRRRDGLEPVWYPSPAVRGVLEKTLGVPLFQEQVMRVAVVAAGFTPGEADQLRRSMAAWGRGGKIESFQIRLIQGMLANGYPPAFAEQIFKQIRGFGEYGFPESHAASFALLVYVSAWLKRYHPAAFTGAILNSLPMGFYAPAQLVRDALRHGVVVLPVDVGRSGWDCSLEERDRGIEGSRDRGEDALDRSGTCSQPSIPCPLDPLIPAVVTALRLGLRLIRGLSAEKVRGIEAAQREGGITSIHALARRPDVSRETLLRLAAADAFRSLGLSRRAALWEILALDDHPAPLFAEMEPSEPPANLPVMPMDEVVVQDYDALGLSLNAHPIGLVREELTALKVSPCERLLSARARQRIAVAGLVTHRQRPGTAKGLVFMTLEDETGTANLIIRPQVWDRDRRVGRGKVALIAAGVVERVGAVIHVQVTRLSDLSAQIAPVRAKSRDFH